MIEYFVYLYFNLIMFYFFGKVDIFFYCNEVVNNIIFYVGKNISYFNVVVGEVLDLNNLDSIVLIEVMDII